MPEETKSAGEQMIQANEQLQQQLREQIATRLGLSKAHHGLVTGGNTQEIEQSVKSLMEKHKPKSSPSQRAVQRFTKDRYALPGRK